MMKGSILKNKMILAVDDDPDVLTVLEEEILEACPDCQFHKVTTYKEATERMVSLTYDLILINIKGGRDVNLVKLAHDRNFPIAILTTHPLTSKALEGFMNLKARAYLPQEKMGNIVPFLEDIFGNKYLSEWRLFYDRIAEFFNKKIEMGWIEKSRLPQPA